LTRARDGYVAGMNEPDAPASTNDLLHQVIERLDQLSGRIAAIEDRMQRADFKERMDEAAQQGQDVAAESL
jgi:hypothetical protein